MLGRLVQALHSHDIPLDTVSDDLCKLGVDKVWKGCTVDSWLRSLTNEAMQRIIDKLENPNDKHQ